MSIRVIQILEGGIDLETMKQLPRSLLLESGHRRTTMPISEEQLQIVIGLLAGASDAPPKQVTNGTPIFHEAQDVPGGEIDDEDEQEETAYTDAETGVSSF